MPSTAAETVLSIPELLEAILLNLDMVTLLVSAQRVNRQWLGVIDASIRLQQALYFKPIRPPTKPALAYSTSLDGDRDLYPNPYAKEIVNTFNPLLLKHFGSVFFNLNGQGHFHPACYFTTNMPWWADDHSEAGWSHKLEALDLDVELLPRQRAFMRSGASWRRMLVAQPAPPALGLVWQRYPGVWVTVSKGLITESPSLPASLYQHSSGSMSETGLRLGLLYDLIQYYAGHDTGRFLRSRVVWGGQWQPFPLQDGAIRASNELLEETSIIVQFVDKEDPSPYVEPVNAQDWDKVFKSDDFQLPKHEPVEVYRDISR